MIDQFTDLDIANSIKLIKEPESIEGKVLVGLIIETVLSHADKPTPREIIIYKGNFLEKQVEVKIFNLNPGSKLVGPTALNQIVVKDKNIIGTSIENLPHYPTKTDFTYILGVANLATYEIERMIKEGRNEVLVEVKEVNCLPDINLVIINDGVKAFLEVKNKKIDVTGNVGVSICARIVS